MQTFYTGSAVRTVVAFLLFPSMGLMAQAPVNDHCQDVQPVALATGNSVVFTGNTTGATTDGDNVPGSGLDGFNSPVVWHAFTTDVCADIAVSFCGSATPFMTDYFWNALSLQCPADQLLVSWDYNNSECPDGQPVIHFSEVAAGTYYYPVWADPSGPVGDYIITISAVACAPSGPANDLCDGATPHNLALGDTLAIAGDNTGATDSEGLGFPTVWESFTLDTCANVTVTYCGTSGFSAFAQGLYADCPATLAVTPAAADSCEDGNPLHTYTDLAAGTYWIPVRMDADSAAGAYAIQVTATACNATPPPANDLCDGATPHNLALGDTLAIAGDNTGATDSEGLGFPTVWESFTLDTCANVTVTYCGTSGFSAFAQGLYADCPATLAVTPAAADSCEDGNPLHTYTDLAAGTYWIPVRMDADSAAGAYAIQVITSACGPMPPPANDLCADVTPEPLAAGTTLTFTGTTEGATDTDDYEPGSDLEGEAPSVWHAFTTSECTDVTVSYCGTTPAFGNAWIFLSPSCPAGNDYRVADSFDIVTCPDGNITLSFTALAAGTYFLPVMFDVDQANGPYTIDVTAAACTVPTEYCIPNPSEGPTDGDFIHTVVLEDINYTGANDTNYVDNTAMTTDLSVGGTYSIAITSGDYDEDVYAAWIDYNNDFVFDPATEKLGEFTTANVGETQNITFTVPAGTTLGTKRLRVRCAYGATDMDACTDYTYGETEDYSVEIVLGTGVAGANLPSVSLYPNPSNGTFTVNAGELEGAVQVEIADMSGRVVYSGQHLLQADQPLTLALEGKLAQGSYQLRLVAGQGIRTIPMMVK